MQDLHLRDKFLSLSQQVLAPTLGIPLYFLSCMETSQILDFLKVNTYVVFVRDKLELVFIKNY